MLAAGMLPNPAGGLAQAGIWLVVAWGFLFRTDVVGVMAPEEYASMPTRRSCAGSISENTLLVGGIPPNRCVDSKPTSSRLQRCLRRQRGCKFNRTRFVSWSDD